MFKYITHYHLQTQTQTQLPVNENCNMLTEMKQATTFYVSFSQLSINFVIRLHILIMYKQ